MQKPEKWVYKGCDRSKGVFLLYSFASSKKRGLFTDKKLKVPKKKRKMQLFAEKLRIQSKGLVRLVYVRQYISQKKTKLCYLLNDSKKRGFGPGVRLGQSMLGNIFYKGKRVKNKTEIPC